MKSINIKSIAAITFFASAIIFSSCKQSNKTETKEVPKAKEGLQYYETTGLKQADDIIRISNTAYTKGEIGYMEYIQNLQTAINTRLQYTDAVNQFNQSIILLNYLKGNK